MIIASIAGSEISPLPITLSTKKGSALTPALLAAMKRIVTLPEYREIFRVWGLPTAAIDEYKKRFTVLSTRLVGGKSIVHVLGDQKPEEGFEGVAPDLEDVYFGQLRQQAANAAAPASASAGPSVAAV